MLHVCSCGYYPTPGSYAIYANSDASSRSVWSKTRTVTERLGRLLGKSTSSNLRYGQSRPPLCYTVYTYMYVVHPESFRSNAQIAIAFACRNRPRVNHSDEFACVYLRSRVFASTVRDRLRACTCVRTYVRVFAHTLYMHIYARRELHLKSIK